MFIKGYKQTEEHKRKIGDRLRGKKKNYTVWNKGKQLSEEHKLKLRIKGGHKHTEDTKRKMSEDRKGSKSHLWKGGITPLNKLIRSTYEYRLWREAVFKRDNYTCIWCGAKCVEGKRITLNADHIKPFAYFPELRFAIDNGRTLCIECHKKTDTYLNRWLMNSSK